MLRNLMLLLLLLLMGKGESVTTAQLQQQLVQLQILLSQLQETFIQQEETIGQQGQNITIQGQTIIQLQQNITQQGQVITQQEEMIAEQGQVIDQQGQNTIQLQLVNSQQGQSIAQLRQAITQQGQSITELQQKFAQQGQTITRQEQTISQQGQTTTTQQGQTTTRKGQTTTQLQQTITQQEQTTSSYQQGQTTTPKGQTTTELQQTITQQEQTTSFYTTSTIAFTATLPPNNEAYSPSTPLVFSNVVTNVGGAYSPLTGLFTASLDGLYYLSFSVLSPPNSEANVEIVMTGEVTLSSIHDGATSAVNVASSVVVLLNAWQQVWVMMIYGSVLSSIESSFTGFLLVPQLRPTFFAQLTSNSAPAKTPPCSQCTPMSTDQVLVMSIVQTNVGEAYNSTTGVFTSPNNGLYFFTFGLSTYSAANVTLMKTGNVSITAAFTSCLSGQSSTLIGAATVQLNAGDQVWLVVGAGSSLCWSNGTGDSTSFVGIVPLLNEVFCVTTPSFDSYGNNVIIYGYGVRYNSGTAFNPTSGVFTAQTAGFYFFGGAFAAYYRNCFITIYLNGNTIVGVYNSAGAAVVSLNVGDQITLVLMAGSAVYNGAPQYGESIFTGFLIG